MYVKLRDEFMVDGPVHLKQLGYLLNAVGECNVNHFCELSNDGVSVLRDPRLPFYFDLGNNKYRVSLVRNITYSPGVVTFKMFHTHAKTDHSPMICDISTPDEEIYAITFWNIFQKDNIKITSVVALTDVDEQLEELIREYDKDLRAIEPGLKEHLEKLIDEMEVNFIDDIDEPVHHYVLLRHFCDAPEAVSTDKSKLEKLRDAICKREDLKPSSFEIFQYEEYDDSYVSNLPEDPVYLIRFAENYEIIKRLRLTSKRDNVYASVLDFDDEIDFVNKHGSECDSFMDESEGKFYCRAKSANQAVVKYHKFIEERNIPNEQKVDIESDEGGVLNG